MATLDEIQAQLGAQISRAAEARMLSTRTGPGPDGEWAATLAAEVEVRLMQDAPPAEENEVLATCTGLLQEGESMPTLTDEIKTFIVKGLACYDTPSQVAEAVKVNFNVEITRQHVYAYDPNASQHMSPRWRELHAATRQALLREHAEIGIAHRAVRLRRLDRLASRCERNNVRESLKCLEMAAKECGGLYENRRPIVLQPAMPQNAMPESPTPQPAAIQTATPQPAATRTARRPAATRPATPQPAAAQAATPQPPAPLPAAPPPVMKQSSMPERPAPQGAAPKTSAPQPHATPLQPKLSARPTPFLSVPLPVMPQPDMPPSSAPPPLAVLAQTPQGPALPTSPPLSRVDRYLAYVRDRHARDRAVAAQALLYSAGISTVPPAS